jgi:uncharacterized membrane protein
MTIFEKGLVTVLACDALFIALSIPLVLRKVGPNVVYGYRTRATLGDEELWYAANEYFGGRFIVASLVSAAAAWYVSRSGLLSADTFLPVSVVLLGAPVLIAGILTSRFVRRLTVP